MALLTSVALIERSLPCHWIVRLPVSGAAADATLAGPFQFGTSFGGLPGL